MVLEDINNRQKGLVGDFSEHSAIVVGLGGIGNWIALDLALIGVGTLILFDNDKVEASNLNRTLFKLGHIGKPKVSAVKELISERRIEDALGQEIAHMGCLLCSEQTPEFCHRRLVAEYLADKWKHVEIVHLV